MGSRWKANRVMVGCLRTLPALGFVALAGAAPAQTTGSSSAHGVSVSATLVPILGGGVPISLGPLPLASGSAPAPYDDSDTEASVLLSTGLTGEILSTGLLEATASSTIPGATEASASATVDDLDLSIVGSLIAKLLTLSATTVGSTASIDGACGALTATGATIIEDAQVGGLAGLGLTIPGEPTPNLVLLDAFGIRIVLNEQIVSGNGVTTRAIAVNAIHVEVDVSLLGIGALSGDIVLAHSEAQVANCTLVPTASPSPTPTPGATTPTPGGATPTPTPTPTPGVATPTPGGATPTPGPATPTPGGATPTPGPATPTPGGATPTPGPATPTPGGATPTPGGATPTPGGATPTPGGATPTPGGATPTPGGATPTPGAATPTPGAATPIPTAGPTRIPPPPTPTPLPGDPGDDPYTDDLGLGRDGFAGATLNPNGIGQLLYGTLYDVRPVTGIGGIDAQNVNLRITNTQPIGAENGGVLVRVRFRESATSREVYAFDVALSCGEDWAGMVYLNGGGASALPAIRSVMPIVSGISDGQIVTAPSLDPANGGAAGVFSVPAGASVEDVRRGYFEVIAQEQLPCEPIELEGFSRDGNTFLRLSGEAATPPNTLSGQVVLIRPSAGSSFAYDMPAIARFVIAGGGSIQAPIASGLPDVSSCVGWDTEAEATYTGLPACLDQIDLVLAKASVHALYDVSPTTAGRTYVIVTLPTKGVHCPPGTDSSSAPFRCSPAGERVGCRMFDREENELLPSPSCSLPREMSFLEIGGGDVNSRADARIGTGSFTSGWLALSYASDPFAGGTGVHEHRGLDPATTSFLGVPADGFRGLPALTLVLQEYSNGNVGGSFGMAVEAPGALEILGLER